MLSRADAFERLREPFDILVIGGGVTGAGILLEAARRGLRVALVERGDFASGTSSRSSKLVHGGLRYIKEGKLGLIREAVHEREVLLREAPGLVEPMTFLLPHYRGKGPGRVATEVALIFYDRFTGKSQHRYRNARQTLQLAPFINDRGLTGAHLYTDATTDDARLVLRLIQEAQSAGAVACNYADAVALVRRGDAVTGAIVRDVHSGGEVAVSAGVVINATGAFADELRAGVGASPKVRPLRGSHMLLAHKRLPVAQAIAFSHPRDGRPVFAYPWLGTTLVGTTDLDHKHGLREEPVISPDEVTYLLEALAFQFPKTAIDRSDIMCTYAGVRPVVASGKADPSQETREHLLLQEHGLITITGGKLTTFRPMALAALEAAATHLSRRIDLRPNAIFEHANDASPHMNGRFGSAARDVLAAAKQDELEPVAATNTLWCELRWAARAECVTRLDDLLLRRTRLGLQLPHGAAEIFPRLESICEEELRWDSQRWEKEIVAYTELMKTHYGVPA